MLEHIGFMFFSIIETVAVYYIIATLFRYTGKEFIWEALIVSLIINLMSYILRNELELAFMVPLITIVTFMFFFKLVVKIPLVWSLMCTILGYGLYVLIQVLLTVTLFGSVAAAQSSLSNGYLLQFGSGLIAFLISVFCYNVGWGFKFDFERLRFKFEDVSALVLIIGFMLMVSTIFYLNQLSVLIFFFASIVVFLLYYAVWKERGR